VERENKKRKQIFYAGIALFAVGVALTLYGYAVPSPVADPTVQYDAVTYFFPFLNWLTIGGIALAVAVLALSKRRKQK
jgi:LPXTG-motif cell wall-anchored protein